MNVGITRLLWSSLTLSPTVTVFSNLYISSFRGSRAISSFVLSDSAQSLRFSQSSFTDYLNTPLKITSAVTKTIRRSGLRAKFNDLLFQRCRSDSPGGGIYVSFCGKATIRNCMFRDCISPTGGAFYMIADKIQIGSIMAKQCRALSYEAFFTRADDLKIESTSTLGGKIESKSTAGVSGFFQILKCLNFTSGLVSGGASLCLRHYSNTFTNYATFMKIEGESAVNVRGPSGNADLASCSFVSSYLSSVIFAGSNIRVRASNFVLGPALVADGDGHVDVVDCTFDLSEEEVRAAEGMAELSLCQYNTVIPMQDRMECPISIFNVTDRSKMPTYLAAATFAASLLLLTHVLKRKAVMKGRFK